MYILKGFWDNEPAYLVEILHNNCSGSPIVNLSTSVDSAKKYYNPDDAEEDLGLLTKDVFKIYPICPLCGKDYDNRPALSRKDNKTLICSNCGVGEAFFDFIQHQDNSVDLGESVITFIETQKKATNL